MIRTLNLFTDGASKGNPGKGGIGFIVKDESNEEIILKGSQRVGVVTNNQAEYMSLLMALEKLKKTENLGDFKLKIFSDSELLVKQINGDYSVRSSKLVDLYLETKTLLRYFNYKMRFKIFTHNLFLPCIIYPIYASTSFSLLQFLS